MATTMKTRKKNTSSSTKKISRTLRASKQNPVRVNREQMVAEAAYYISERRGFLPEYDQQNWFEAEAQIATSKQLSNDY